jgi:hypothetical protein
MTRRARILAPLLLFVLSSFAVLPLAASGKGHQAESASDTSFDERAAAQALGVLRNGLEGHSQHLFLSAFDSTKMEGYLTFEDQIEAYFTRYESFRISYHILQTSQEEKRGVILADFQIENEPRGGGRLTRRQAQLRFELENTSKGWKIVDMSPRGFFF